MDPVDPFDQMLRGRAAPEWTDRLRSAAADHRRPLLVVGSLLAAAVVAIILVRAPSGSPSISLPRTGSVPAGRTSAATIAAKGSDPDPPVPGAPTGATTTVATELVVHVAGAVERPGLVRLTAGARVADAVTAAGGLRSDADGDRLNLAAPVADGTRVFVPAVGQGDPPAAAPVDGASVGPGSASGAAVDGTVPAPVVVDVNTASIVELDTLPGVGPTTAAAIIDYRDEHGPFGSVDELQDVRGIGPAKYDALARPRDGGTVTEREVVGAALLVALAAAVAWPVPWWVVGLVVAVAAGARRPPLAVVALAVVATAVGARAEAGVAVPGPGRDVRGAAAVLTEPELRPGGAVLEVRVGGRRYRSFVSGDPATALAAASVGDRFVVTGRTATLDAPWEWMASRHLAGRLRIDEVADLRSGAWWWRCANGVHRLVGDGLGSFAPPERALFLGVLLGDDRNQSEVERHRFRASGLAHLLAVSGQNVAFVLVVASPLLRRLPLRWRWASTGIVLIWFALVTRLEPSVLRAVTMAMIATTAAWRGRFASGVRVVSVAVIALVLVDPLLVWSIGFRLSVAASATLVTIARPLARRLPGPRLLADALGVSLAAQVATAPVLVAMSGSVPLLGPVFNLAAVPVAGWLMVWGAITAPLAGIMGDPFAAVLGWPSRGFVRWLSWVAHLGSLPVWPRMGPLGVAGMTAGVAAWIAEPSVCSDHRHPALLLRAIVAAAALTVGLDAAAVAGRPAVVADGTVRVWAGTDVVVMDLGPRPTERWALDAFATTRRGRVDVVIVTGGGRLASQVVWSLRQVAEVGVVLASHPESIRDAQPLVAGTIAVGDIGVRVSEDDAHRWTVVGPAEGWGLRVASSS